MARLQAGNGEESELRGVDGRRGTGHSKHGPRVAARVRVMMVAGAVGRLVMVVGISVVVIPFPFLRMSEARVLDMIADGRSQGVILGC